MIKEYEEGAGMAALAAKYRVAHQTIRSTLVANDVEIRKPGPPRGEKHGSWRGGKHINSNGYVLVRVYPEDPMYVMAYSNGYVPKHRLVMARSLGRPLTEYETVHHKDNNPKNNRLSNLQLRQGRHGKGAVLVCADCGSHDLKALELS